MKITYDNEVDALYISLKQAKSAKQQMINDDIIADFDIDGNLTGLEVLNLLEKIRETQ